MIHPTAIVHPKARLDSSTRVGPFAVIDEGVEIGPGCVVGPHAYLTGLTKIGARNRFFAGCVIGEAPQDLKYKGVPSCLRIGDDNTFRENVTVHRSNTGDTETVVGSTNLLMAGCHVAHDCRVGNNVILANGALLAGHVTVDDRALISGNCVIHQFVRVGTLAMMQGGSAISKDLPPYMVSMGVNELCGLNTTGLRRAGMSPDERLELKQLYKLLFRKGRVLSKAIAEARSQFSSPPCRLLLDFVASSKRGVCADPGSRKTTDAQSGDAL